MAFTTGVLIGIGETFEERVDTLLAIRDIQQEYGHIQEVIIQNFRAKAGTRMAGCAEPSPMEVARTVAVARLILGGDMNIQAPPNLNPPPIACFSKQGSMIGAGFLPSPATISIQKPLGRTSMLLRKHAGRRDSRWLNDWPSTTTLLIAMSSLLKTWLACSTASAELPPENLVNPIDDSSREVRRILDVALQGADISWQDALRLCETEGADLYATLAAADELRRRQVGDVVSYVINRNINFTNVCVKHCGFCALAGPIEMVKATFCRRMKFSAAHNRQFPWAPPKFVFKLDCRRISTDISISISPAR